jgi:hypothetical protein
MIQASAGSGVTWQVGCWDGAAWDNRNFSFNVGASTGTPVLTFESASIIRNDYEAATVRLMEDKAPGRVVVDLTVRRGSRFLEASVRSDRSTVLAFYRSGAEAGTSPASSGYIRATANDPNGHRYVIGSARSFTPLTTQGGITKTSATSLDFFFGFEVGGSAAQTGDDAATMVSHYLTAMSEVTVAGLR